jgi:D-tyrosyl-tRNA(Tyr) deacylase
VRAVLQRVRRAEVRVGERTTGRIGIGFVILLGVGRGDSENDAKFLVDRVAGIRVFADAAGKMNLSLDAAHGDLLVISQFTLYADTSQRRPSFSNAAPPDEAERLYELFLSLLRARGVKVETGEFGATMDVDLINDGPVTIILDSRDR